MKRTLLLLFLFLSIAAISQVRVNGYYRKNGTYVAPHYRSSPDGNPYNNYSFPGNTNPYTGKVATGNPDTYLNRYNSRRKTSVLNYPGSGGYYSGYSEWTFDIGYQATTSSPLGGYMIFSNNNVSIGVEGGGGNERLYNSNYQTLYFGGYWSGFIGYKGIYAGLGQNLMYDNNYFEDKNEILVTTGYHGYSKSLSYKMGIMYSETIGFCGSLGIGVNFY